MKRTLSILAAAMALVAAMNGTAFAHGNHGTGRKAGTQPQYARCTVENCVEIGLHQHSGNWYCSNYKTCEVSGCTKTGLHEHDGAYYCGRNHDTGHGHGRRNSQQ